MNQMKTWRLRGELLDLSQRGMIMGIVNVTPDSFSDGGHYFDHDRAIAHGMALIEQGADILDIGGESTRPGAATVATSDEWQRVVPVIAGLRARSKVYISVDTRKSAVAERALDAGADIINDVSGLTHDSAMADIAVRYQAGIVLMHMQGQPSTMQQAPHYDDVVADVRRFFRQRLLELAVQGIDARQVALDPGFGFGKTLDHNLTLLKHLPDLAIGSCPLLVGISRKSMIGQLVESPDLADRHWPTAALTAWLSTRGAQIHRVHDVAANAQSLRMREAIGAAS
jgi:dihydropteroate synthase